MSSHINHIIHAAQDSEVAVRRLHCAIAGKVRPIMPVFALGVPVVLAVVLRHKAVAVAPDGLKHSRPRIADTDVPCLARTGLYLFALFIEDHGVDARNGGSGAAWLHGI